MKVVSVIFLSFTKSLPNTYTHTHTTQSAIKFFSLSPNKGKSKWSMKRWHGRWCDTCVLGHKCFPLNWFTAPYSTLQYGTVVQLNSVQFEFNLARVDLVRFNGKIIHVFIPTQRNCLVSLSYEATSHNTHIIVVAVYVYVCVPNVFSSNEYQNMALASNYELWRIAKRTTKKNYISHTRTHTHQ